MKALPRSIPCLITDCARQKEEAAPGEYLHIRANTRLGPPLLFAHLSKIDHVWVGVFFHVWRKDVASLHAFVGMSL